MSTTPKRHILPHVHFIGEVVYEAMHEGEVYEINGEPGCTHTLFSYGKLEFVLFKSLEEAEAHVEKVKMSLDDLTGVDPEKFEAYVASLTIAEITPMAEPKTDYPAQPWPEHAAKPSWLGA
jgi:hypothetical protein